MTFPLHIFPHGRQWQEPASNPPTRTKYMKTKVPQYSDLIATRAWRDWDDADDDDGGWRVQHLWIYGGDKRSDYSTCDSDGNHEPCSARDAKTFSRDEGKSWKDYAEWVAEHGTDPLMNYRVEYTTKRTETWVARVRKAIGYQTCGLSLVSARRKGGKSVKPGDLPAHVSEFLELKKYGQSNYCLEGIVELSDATHAKAVAHRHYTTFTFEVERVIPRPAKTVRRELIALAKRP